MGKLLLGTYKILYFCYIASWLKMFYARHGCVSHVEHCSFSPHFFVRYFSSTFFVKYFSYNVFYFCRLSKECNTTLCWCLMRSSLKFYCLYYEFYLYQLRSICLYSLLKFKFFSIISYIFFHKTKFDE